MERAPALKKSTEKEQMQTGNSIPLLQVIPFNVTLITHLKTNLIKI